MNKYFWAGLDELANTSAFEQAIAKEFAKSKTVHEFLRNSCPQTTPESRRDTLLFLGFIPKDNSTQDEEKPPE